MIECKSENRKSPNLHSKVQKHRANQSQDTREPESTEAEAALGSGCVGSGATGGSRRRRSRTPREGLSGRQQDRCCTPKKLIEYNDNGSQLIPTHPAAVVLKLAPERTTVALLVADVASAAWVTTGGPALPLLPGFDAGDDPPLKQLGWM